jgi:hypothetical protein
MWIRRKTLDQIQRDHARERAAWAAERREMLNRIMYMADRPWMLPDYAVKDEPTEDELESDFTYPEQLALT